MANENIKKVKRPSNSGGKILFKNKFLERLTRTHISVPITILCIFATGMVAWAVYYNLLSSPTIISMFFAGMLTFSLVEYLVHRYLFHITPNSKAKEKLQYTIHGVHHEFPKDVERLAMPPVLSAIISVVLLFLFVWAMGDYALAFLPGFLVGYCAYLGVHFIVHAWSPPNNFFKKLWINHSIHHYKDNQIAFGVSSPLWDYVFGTIRRKK
ncbi:MAG: sterol desaturase family protein [Bacteroidetes bacterium]|nr:sterol desaturase family protein [Bacteroidota bacterium]